MPSQSLPCMQVSRAASVQPPYFLPRWSATSFIFSTLVGKSCGSVCRPQAISSPEPVLAATDAFGCTSSKDSLNTFISVPVALENAATMPLKASSSDGTNRFQRIKVSFAPGSAFQGESAAQALAKSSSAGPVSAAPAASAVPPWSRARRVKSCMVILSLDASCLSVEPLARALVKKMHERGVGFQADLVARIELVALAEHRDHLLAAEIGENLRFGAGRLDDDDFGFGAVIGNGEVLGTDAIDRGSAVRSGRRRS